MKLPQQRLWPTEWHIGEETYTLKWVSRFPGKDQDLSGLCCGASHTVYIKTGLTKNQAFRTLVHELIHAMEFEYELQMPHKLVHQLERAIADLVLQNF